MPFMSPRVPEGRHKGHQHGVWHSLSCYKLLGPDVAPGFSYMSVGRWHRSRDRQIWQQCPRPLCGCGVGQASPQQGTVAFCGHVKAQLGCAGWLLTQGHGSVMRGGVGQEASGTHYSGDAEAAFGSREKVTHPTWWAGGKPGPGCRTRDPLPHSAFARVRPPAQHWGYRFLGPFLRDKRALFFPVMGSLDRTAPCQA